MAKLAPVAVALVVIGAIAFQNHHAATIPMAPQPQAGTIAETLFLIGDAGEPAKDFEPVLTALRRQVEAAAPNGTIVFLGDNLYGNGLPGPQDPERPEMERRLADQVDAVKDLGARVIFVPGNHDWDDSGPDGWAAVRRAERYIEERGGEGTVQLPNDGCPGPEVVDTGDRLRLIALDTQWWLHDHERPEGPDSPCPTRSEKDVTSRLAASLSSAGARAVVVVGHHPLVSSGPHGGKFGIKEHLFPLTQLKKNLWLPLPILGSIYTAARRGGISPQDISSDAYIHMRRTLVSAALGHPPLAWAGGHEHALEVIEDPLWGRVLVSGAGIYGHVSKVRGVEGSRFSAGRSGFMRIDFLRTGERRLSVVEVDSKGGAREGYAEILK